MNGFRELPCICKAIAKHIPSPQLLLGNVPFRTRDGLVIYITHHLTTFLPRFAIKSRLF